MTCGSLIISFSLSAVIFLDINTRINLEYTIAFCSFMSSFCLYMSVDNFEKRKIRNFDNMDLLKMESKVDPESISNMAKKASQNESKNDLNSGSNENRDLAIEKGMSDEADILQTQYRRYTRFGFGILVVLMIFYCIKFWNIKMELNIFLTSLPFTIAGYVGFIFCSKRSYMLNPTVNHLLFYKLFFFEEYKVKK